jgi:small conductance mechanosensitive channel
MRRLDITVGISYGDDLVKVKKVVLAAVEQLEERDPNRQPEFFYKAFGDSSINFDLRIWLKGEEQIIFLKAQSDAIMFIKKAFDQNEITIPFPIRTLDFGIKGGKTLSEMKLNLIEKLNNEVGIEKQK